MSKLQKKVLSVVNNVEKTKGLQAHGNVTDVMLTLKFADGWIHKHYPGKEEVAKELIASILAEKQISGEKILTDNEVERIAKRLKQYLLDLDAIEINDSNIERLEDKPKENRKIVFGHHRALGDEVMMTVGVRDFKLLFPEIEIGVDGNHPALWENNPYINHDLKKDDPGVEYFKVGYPMVGNANNTAMHFTTMFLFDMISIADLHIPLPLKLGEFTAAFANGNVGDPSLGNTKKNTDAKEPFISLREKYEKICQRFVRQKGDLHLTETEKSTNIIRDVYGIEKYWVIAPGGKRDATTKIWDWRRFQKVVDHFDGLIKFVMIGKGDLLVEDEIKGVINLVDKFNKDLRGLFSLIYNAEGCVSGPSALMHLAAALPKRDQTGKYYAKPCVTILGGREPQAWTWYCNHQILHTNGAFDCCSSGGCWKARTYPLQKDPKHNKNLCHHTVQIDGRTVQECMHTITSKDVIRAIEKYYEGNIYTYMKPKKATESVRDPLNLLKDAEVAQLAEPQLPAVETVVRNHSSAPKEINLLGNLNTSGGGEQSLMMIAQLLQKSGWKVNMYPWGSVNKNYINQGIDIKEVNFSDDDGVSMSQTMVPDIPLLFYANDCVWSFPKHGQKVVEKSSQLIVGINFMLGDFKKWDWLSRSGKLSAVIFQNTEKKDEWINQAIGYEDTELIVMYGAIDLNKFYEVAPQQREDKEEMVVLKHCKPDKRKYVTEESKDKGSKIHIWQKHFGKELDTKFYKRLLKDIKNVRFEFMEAHKELVEAFKNEPRMVFHKWDSMDVGEFLSRGHVYLYRTSNDWRDNYPRVMAEALAAGLPVIGEPRDGPLDRIQHGDTGLYAIHYDDYLLHLKTLYRKEKFRHQMGMNAKEWSRKNLNPNKWVDVIERLCNE